jgi:hypothetical protein
MSTAFHDKIKTQDYPLFVDGGNDIGKFQVFGGRLQFLHLPNKEFARRSTAIIDDALRLTLVRALDSIRDAEPNNKLTIIVTAYDREARKRTRKYVFAIEKDEKRCYHLIADVGDGNHKYSLGRASHLVVKGEQLSPADQSGLRLELLKEYLTVTVPLEMRLTNTKWEGQPKQSSARPSSDNNAPKRSKAPAATESTDDGNARPEGWESDLFETDE